MNKVLRLPSVKALTGLSRSTIYLHIQQGAFPKPINLGPRSVGWLECEIEEWLAARIKKRDNREAEQYKLKDRINYTERREVTPEEAL